MLPRPVPATFQKFWRSNWHAETAVSRESTIIHPPCLWAPFVTAKGSWSSRLITGRGETMLALGQFLGSTSSKVPDWHQSLLRVSVLFFKYSVTLYISSYLIFLFFTFHPSSLYICSTFLTSIHHFPLSPFFHFYFSFLLSSNPLLVSYCDV